MAGQDPTVDTGAVAAPTTAEPVGVVTMPQANTQLNVVPLANPEVAAETARQMLGKSREPSAEELAAEGTPASQPQFVPLEAAEQVLQKRMAREAKKLREEQEAAISPLRDALAQVQAGVAKLLEDREEAAPEAEPEAPTAPPTAATPEAVAANSELQKALKRQREAEAKATQATAEAEALRTEKAKAQRDALVAGIVAERGVKFPIPFLPIIEGNDEDEIRESIDAILELGRKTFAPKDIGSPAQPPAAAPSAAAPPTPDEKAQMADEMINAAQDSASPLHAQAKEWLRQQHGKRMG